MKTAVSRRCRQRTYSFNCGTSVKGQITFSMSIYAALNDAIGAAKLLNTLNTSMFVARRSIQLS